MKLENRVPGNGCYHNLATTTAAFENIIPSSGCSGDMNFFLVRGIPPRDVREENAFFLKWLFLTYAVQSQTKKWAGIHHLFFPLLHLLKLVQGGRGFRHMSMTYLYKLESREYFRIIDKY